MVRSESKRSQKVKRETISKSVKYHSVSALRKHNMQFSPTIFEIVQQCINIINQNHLFHQWYATEASNKLFLVKYLQYS